MCSLCNLLDHCIRRIIYCTHYKYRQQNLLATISMFLTVHSFVDFGIGRCKGLGIVNAYRSTSWRDSTAGNKQRSVFTDPFGKCSQESYWPIPDSVCTNNVFLKHAAVGVWDNHQILNIYPKVNGYSASRVDKQVTTKS